MTDEIIKAIQKYYGVMEDCRLTGKKFVNLSDDPVYFFKTRNGIAGWTENLKIARQYVKDGADIFLTRFNGEKVIIEKNEVEEMSRQLKEEIELFYKMRFGYYFKIQNAEEGVPLPSQGTFFFIDSKGVAGRIGAISVVKADYDKLIEVYFAYFDGENVIAKEIK